MLSVNAHKTQQKLNKTHPQLFEEKSSKQKVFFRFGAAPGTKHAIVPATVPVLVFKGLKVDPSQSDLSREINLPRQGSHLEANTCISIHPYGRGLWGKSTHNNSEAFESCNQGKTLRCYHFLKHVGIQTNRGTRGGK